MNAENWVINNDVICLSGGEITHFLMNVNHFVSVNIKTVIRVRIELSILIYVSYEL